MCMQIRSPSPSNEPIKMPPKEPKVKPAISEKNIEKYESLTPAPATVYKENRPPIEHLKPALGSSPVSKVIENSPEVKNKKIFAKEFIHIYFEKEGKEKLLKSVDKMSDAEFKFFWQSMVSYLNDKSEGLLFMSPILKDSLPKGSLLGKRAYEKVNKNGKQVLELISSERLKKMSKTQKKNIVWIEHKGNDIPTEKGTAIYLPAPGIVTEIKVFNLRLAKNGKPTNIKTTEYSVSVKHPGTNFISKYVHLGSLPKNIVKGAQLDFGDHVGDVDGRASFRKTEKGLKTHSKGSHLHYEVRTKEGELNNYHSITLLKPAMLSFSGGENQQVSLRIKTNEFLVYLQSKKNDLAFRLTQQSV